MTHPSQVNTVINGTPDPGPPLSNVKGSRDRLEKATSEPTGEFDENADLGDLSPNDSMRISRESVFSTSSKNNSKNQPYLEITSP